MERYRHCLLVVVMNNVSTFKTKGRGGRNKQASICVRRVSDRMHMGNTCLSFSLTVPLHL